MNLHDLCADGLEWYKEFNKYAEAFRIHGRVQSMAMMYIKHEKFLDHLEGCVLCTQEELGDE